jgi:hypothetical protein
MRLAKPVVAALELIAAGGAVLILSGSAFAAEGSTSVPAQAGVTPNTSANQQNAEPATGEAVQPVANTQQSANPSDVKPSEDSQTADGQNGEVKVDPQTKSSLVSSGPAQATGAAQGMVNVAGNSMQTSGMPQSQGASKVGAAITNKVSPADKVTAAPVVPPLGQDQPKLPMGGQMAQAPLPVVVFKSSILPIQPTITSRATSVINDLATSVPTPPKPDKAPVPAKSSGALGRLTAVLASVVVPPSFSLPSLVSARMALELLLGLILLVLIAVFVFSYGLWLRRGGFATAARSDSPVAAAILYLLHHSIWAMFERRRAKDVAQILVSELAGAQLSRAA